MSSSEPKIQQAVEDEIDSRTNQLTAKSLDTAENLASDTTAQQDLVTLGQRKINLIWERTQATVAVIVTGGTLSACLLIIYRGGDSPLVVTAFVLISNIFFMIATFYFQRTNHTKTGGVGGSDSR